MSNTIVTESTANSAAPTDFETTETPIVQQFKKLQQMVLLHDTAATFSKSLGLLFALTKETMILVWLAFCWGIVGLSLAGGSIKQMRQGLMNWWSKLHYLERKSTKDIATETAQSFVSKSQYVVQNLVIEAKKQVGLQEHQ